MNYTQENSFTQFGPIRKTQGNNSEGVGFGNVFAPTFVDTPKQRSRRQDLTTGVENTAGSWPSNGTSVMLPKWVEINICVNGVPKKMKVVGTDPY